MKRYRYSTAVNTAVIAIVFSLISGAGDAKTVIAQDREASLVETVSQSRGSSQHAALAQELYYPPADPAQWERISPESLGWDTDKLEELIDWLDDSETRAFIVLKGGRIVVEQYFRWFTIQPETPWYWASAGKTVTALLIGALEQQGLLDINNPVSHYLGQGWTSLTTEQEQRITVRHQLAMTTGLEYEVEDIHCTLPECLQFRQPAGEQWFYHNAPYTLLTHVLEAAADTTLNALVDLVLADIPGLELQYREGGLSEYNRSVWSSPLDMARFGLFVSRGSRWENSEPVLDSLYQRDMLQPSQQINPSYGYLWWINGQESFIPPQLAVSLSGPLIPQAPADMVSALGMHAQVLSLIPSRDLVVVRMGADPGGLFSFIRHKWELFDQVIGTPVSSEAQVPGRFYLEQNRPNPFNPSTLITYRLTEPGRVRLQVYDQTGRLVSTLVEAYKKKGTHHVRFDAGGLSSGVYYYRLQTEDGSLTRAMTLLQ